MLSQSRVNRSFNAPGRCKKVSSGSRALAAAVKRLRCACAVHCCGSARLFPRRACAGAQPPHAHLLDLRSVVHYLCGGGGAASILAGGRGLQVLCVAPQQIHLQRASPARLQQQQQQQQRHHRQFYSITSKPSQACALITQGKSHFFVAMLVRMSTA